MNNQDVWQTIEESGIHIRQHERNSQWWGYSIRTKQLSTDWHGPYTTQLEALHVALHWLMSNTTEHLSINGFDHVHLYTVPTSPHQDRLDAFEHLLTDEDFAYEKTCDEETVDVILDPSDVIYNETMGRVEYQGTGPLIA